MVPKPYGRGGTASTTHPGSRSISGSTHRDGRPLKFDVLRSSNGFQREENDAALGATLKR